MRVNVHFAQISVNTAYHNRECMAAGMDAAQHSGFISSTYMSKDRLSQSAILKGYISY